MKRPRHISEMVSNLRRLKEIISIFANFFWRAFFVLKGKDEETEAERAVLLRKSLESLGSVFIKFGQFLALRPDILSSTYTQELFFLLENVPPFPYKELVKIFQEEFKTSPDTLFSSFNQTPFAAASFGQVHEAYLKTGERVAVKVLRPCIKEIVQRDLNLMKFLAKVGDFLMPQPNKTSPMITEFEKWTNEELDYTTEAQYTTEFYERTKNDPESIFAPKIFPNYCSSKILTAEYIGGTTIGNIILALKNNDRTLLHRLKELGFSRKEVSLKLLKETVKQIYLDGFFHADPHPANIIFTNNGRLAYIDFGIVGKLSKNQRLLCLRYTRSALYGDNENAFEALIQLCDASTMSDLQAFKKEHGELIKDTLELFEKKKAADRDPHVVGRKLIKTLQLMHKYKITIPFDTLRYFRALPTLESVVLTLYPEMKIEDMAGKFRNISLLNVATELPSIITKENLNQILLSWLNSMEKELLKKG